MAVEDFTGYTEVDPNTRIAVIASKVTWTALAKNEDAYVYKDFGADIKNILTVGHSRGGGTALLVAGNPYHKNYKVKYALAYDPARTLGDVFTYNINPTYGLMLDFPSFLTGYRKAWKQGWTDPVKGLSYGKLSMFNTTGSMDRNAANSISALSERNLQNLKKRGIKVLLSSGTHDAGFSYNQIINALKRARELGIPMRCEHGYRHGHWIVTKKMKL